MNNMEGEKVYPSNAKYMVMKGDYTKWFTTVI